MKYLDDEYLFVAYLVDQETLAMDHREKGVSFSKSHGAHLNNKGNVSNISNI